jgi:hypothetical protein
MATILQREIDISAEFSKRISDKFGISIGTDWTQLSPAGASRVNGFQNLQRYRGGRHRSNALLSRRLFPDSIGKPLFGTSVTPARSPLGN